MELYGLLLTILLVLAFLVLHSRRPAAGVVLVGTQSMALALTAAWWGREQGLWEMYLAVLFIVAVKGLAIPWVLLRAVRRTGSHLEQGVWGPNALLLVAAALVALAFYTTSRWTGTFGPETGLALPVAIGVVLVGLVVMVGKRLALTQVLGLLVMENGLFLTALAMTGSLPVLVEMGILFDALVGAVIMTMFCARINDTFATQDTSKLSTLKG